MSKAESKLKKGTNPPNEEEKTNEKALHPSLPQKNLKKERKKFFFFLPKTSLQQQLQKFPYQKVSTFYDFLT